MDTNEDFIGGFTFKDKCFCHLGKKVESMGKHYKHYTYEECEERFPSPYRPELKYKIEKDNFVILQKNDKGKWFEKYWINKIGCSDLYRQYDWILHMERKPWIDGYKFAKEFSKAIKQWGY